MPSFAATFWRRRRNKDEQQDTEPGRAIEALVKRPESIRSCD